VIRVLFIVVALLCAYSSEALSSVNPSCQEVFGDEWSLSDDADAFRNAELFISYLDEPYVPFVCVGHDDLPSPARTLRGGVGPPWTLYIGVDDRYLRDERESLRGLMAHEIAHYFFGDGLLCAGYWSDEMFDAYQKCEEGVDRIAAHWTSNHEIAGTLQSVHAFALLYFPEDANPRTLPLLEERIRILTYAR
jgi:hypothetical protein